MLYYLALHFHAYIEENRSGMSNLFASIPLSLYLRKFEKIHFQVKKILKYLVKIFFVSLLRWLLHAIFFLLKSIWFFLYLKWRCGSFYLNLHTHTHNCVFVCVCVCIAQINHLKCRRKGGGKCYNDSMIVQANCSSYALMHIGCEEHFEIDEVLNCKYYSHITFVFRGMMYIWLKNCLYRARNIYTFLLTVWY